MNSMNKYQAKRYLVLTTHIMAIICLILEVVICFVFERENFETNDIKWLFRWVILSNILNGTIIAVEFPEGIKRSSLYNLYLSDFDMYCNSMSALLFFKYSADIHCSNNAYYPCHEKTSEFCGMPVGRCRSGIIFLFQILR